MSHRFAEIISKVAIPLGITVTLGQSALYDVEGGKRAVIFDRLNGVQQQVIGKEPTF